MKKQRWPRHVSRSKFARWTPAQLIKRIKLLDNECLALEALQKKAPNMPIAQRQRLAYLQNEIKGMVEALRPYKGLARGSNV